MKSVVVLAGGVSDEREVSLRSGQAVAAALTNGGYIATLLDLQADPAEHLAAMQAADVVFPALHGSGGEDGVLQTYLEANHICYVGSDAAVSALCFDKWRTKQLFGDNHIPTPPGELVTRDNIWQSPLVQQPFVLKPYNGGSSIDTFIVRDVTELDKSKIMAALQRYEGMLLESLIVGTELTVGVLGATALPVIEIVPPSEGEFDYENKYNGATQELCPPTTVSTELQHQAQQIAEAVHKACGCRDLSRTDMMLSTSGELFVLEINTLPGMTNQSLLPKAAATAGITMNELCSQLVEMALQRA